MVDVDWEGFKRWLERDKSRYYARDIYYNARKYADYLFGKSLSDLARMSEGKRRVVMSSLANLAKFLGIYPQWKSKVQSFSLKWSSAETRDKRVVDRLTKVVDVNDLYQWIRQVGAERPELTCFLEFMAITGLRLTEAVNSFNLIVELSGKGKLADYYDAEKEVLEHYKFKDKFLRKGKKAFISFVPKEFLKRLENASPVPGAKSLVKLVSRLGLHSRFSDLRELHASVMTKYLNQSEINFLHGRIGTSVFMQNYFNPAWIGDLKQRVFKGIAEIQKKLRKGKGE